MKILAKNIMKKYGTNDPFEIAKKAKIIIVVEHLGNVNGYYNQVDGTDFIHVNELLPDYFRRYILAALLYRVFTNNKEMMFMKSKTGTRFTKSEIQANTFAFNLLVPNGKLTVEILYNVFGLSTQEVDDLFSRLYKIWDEEYKMHPDELLNHIISRISRTP